MNYAEAKQIKEQNYKNLDIAEQMLKAVPGISSGPMGLTPDNVRSTDQYKIAKHAADLAFKNLRDFNQFVNRNFKKELNEERKNKYKNLIKV